MQEGTSSLMQMAKVAVAVEALHQAHLPFIAGECYLMCIILHFSTIPNLVSPRNLQKKIMSYILCPQISLFKSSLRIQLDSIVDFLHYSFVPWTSVSLPHLVICLTHSNPSSPFP